MGHKKSDLMAQPAPINTVPGDGDEDELDPTIMKILRSRTFARKLVGRLEKEAIMRARRATWEDDVRAQIGKDIEIRPTERGAFTLMIGCEEGHTVEWASPNRIPGEAIAAKLKRAGWRLGKHQRCPEHSHQRKHDNDQKGGEVEMATETMTEAQASDAARTAKRLAMLAIDESFNVEKGCYRNGVTDASIAKEIGASVAVVTRLREEFFGPLKVPDDIEDVRRQIEELRRDTADRLREIQTQSEEKMGKLSNRIDSLVRKNKWQDD